MNIKEIATTDTDAKDFTIDDVVNLHIKRNDCGYSFDITDFCGALIEECAVDVETNKYDVPYKEFTIGFEDGKVKCINIGNEEDWGNIQPCVDGDCEDWENSIGYGNDVDGHKKIVWVDDWGLKVKDWYDKCVAPWVDRYSC